MEGTYGMYNCRLHTSDLCIYSLLLLSVYTLHTSDLCIYSLLLLSVYALDSSCHIVCSRFVFTKSRGYGFFFKEVSLTPNGDAGAEERGPCVALHVDRLYIAVEVSVSCV